MLKSLEMFGFKSFADRTLFEFSPGVTCVVGPNGSGKSNVVDSLKWILGDQSAKSLRGKEMADVIFNGSAGRRPSGFAEATLTFDNSEGLLPVDAAEVQVGRRLYRSGDSEYLLNRSPVRLKDIRDMFMGTGAGTAAYSIIEQGRVDQILQANPTTRRMVFEEAAGISKFKSRRVEAERRLERVAQNLLRLTDIVDEVETQLNQTRSQATKATRYREISTELEALWKGLAADDYRHFHDEIEQKDAELDRIQEQIEETQKQLKQIEELRHETDQQISEIDDELLDRERQLATTRETIAKSDATIRYQSKRGKELEEDLRQQRQQRAIIVQRTQFAADELAETGQRVLAFANQVQSIKQELETRTQRIEEYRQLAAERRIRIAELNEQREELDKHQVDHREQLAVLNSEANSLSGEFEECQQQLKQAEDAAQSAHADLRASEQHVAEAEAAQRLAKDELQAMQSTQRDLVSRRDEAKHLLTELRERRSAAEARLTVLKELETVQEGIAIGVREILRRAETSHYPPWNRVLGLVRDLIEVPLELAPVIEAALGERVQLIAVADLDPFLEYLNRGPAPIDGRVGFVSLKQSTQQSEQAVEQLEIQESQNDAIRNLKGVHGRADELVTELPRATGIAQRILGDTWVVETLSVAQQAIEIAPEGTRFVTLQGEVLSEDGQLHVGLVPNESSVISRKSELRALQNEIHQIERNLEATQERSSILSESLNDHASGLSELEKKVQDCTTQVTKANAQLTAQRAETERFEAAYRQLAERSKSVESRKQELEKTRQELQDNIQDLAKQAASILSDVEDSTKQSQDVDERLNAAQSDIKTDQLELAKHEERLTNLKETQRRLEYDQQQREQQLADITQRLQDTKNSHSRIQFEILQAESAIAEAALLGETILRASRSQFRQRDQLRQKRKQLSKQEEELHEQRRKFMDRHRSVELEIQNHVHQLETMEKRIQEEFQTPLKHLVESGASAYQIYLRERYGDDAIDKLIAHHEETVEHTDVSESEDELPSDVEEEAADDEELLVPEYGEVRAELEDRVDRLRRKLKSIGNVNTEALENLEELEQRFTSMSHQLQDLQQAKQALEDIIRRINAESQRIFYETFETIRLHFQELFRKLFGGGNADIILEDPEDVLECGIDIVARPPGKELRSISLLSGGEKTLTAVAMLFAMFKSKPSPYCVLDEVDAALDEANVDRYVTVIKEFSEMTQFVVITHRKRTMTAANVLYGVTMEQAGVSKRISVGFEDVNDNGEIKTAA